MQGGIGSLGDPVAHHGFSLTMNGALGNSNKSNTFGYDNFAVDAKWVSGANKIGKRIIIQFGTANWFTPALSVVYPDTILNQEEKITEAKSVNAFMAGMGIHLGHSRKPQDHTLSDAVKAQITTLELELINAKTSQLRKREIKREIADLRWRHLIKDAFKKPTLTLGGLFRLGALGTQSEIEVFDLYASGAAGKGIFDAAFSFHYLKPVKDNLVAEDALTFSLGAFFDLQDSPPINTMGLTLSYGKFNYLKKEKIIEANTVISETPFTNRLDVTLSFSNIFKSDEFVPLGNSIAVRFSKLWHSSTENESQFVLLFTNKFISERKK